MIFIKNSFIILTFSLCLGVFLTACSSDRVASKSNTSIIESKAPKLMNHTHEANPCTAAVSHAHAHDNKNHNHHYGCENTNDYEKNAHIHPAANGYKRARHVHPNGYKKHSHRR